MSSKKTTIGRVGDAYGVKGWSHVFSFTQPPENLFEYTHWQIRAYQKNNAQWRPIEIEDHKPHGTDFVVKFKGCNDRDQALVLKNHTIAVDRAELPSLKEGEYYWDDLIGLNVFNTQGESFGEIDHLFEAGSNDVICTKGDKTHYIPYTKDVVQSIDLEKKIMIVDWEDL